MAADWVVTGHDQLPTHPPAPEGRVPGAARSQYRLIDQELTPYAAQSEGHGRSDVKGVPRMRWWRWLGVLRSFSFPVSATSLAPWLPTARRRRDTVGGGWRSRRPISST